jgi:hypothetical protein
MEIKKLKFLFDYLVKNINASPEDTYNFFKAEWPKLSYDEREILRAIIGSYVSADLLHDETYPEFQFYWLAILQEAKTEYQGDNYQGKFILSDTIKDIQIAKLFYDLKSHGYIENTIEELATLVSNLFGLKYSTIYSYLNDPKKLIKTKPLFGKNSESL